MGNNHDSKSGPHDAESETLSLPTNTDLLSQVLETVRLRSSVFFLWEPRWPYAVGVPNGSKITPMIMPSADQLISYHIVTEGPCWGCVEGEEPVYLENGDTLLLPQGDAYVIANEPRFPSPADEAPALDMFRQLAAGQLPPVLVNGGSGPGKNRVICGFLGCNLRPFNPLLNTLPRIMRIRPPPDTTDPLTALIELAIAESKHHTEGSRCLLLRLSEAMFVEVIRRYVRTSENSVEGWLGALQDPIVGAAINHLHQKVSHPWTLEALAQVTNTSRSTLAERFSKIVGEPPMQYLTQWRMQLAARRLTQGAVKNFTVAQEVGYESEEAFSRAFKRVVGISPSEWRTKSLQSTDEQLTA